MQQLILHSVSCHHQGQLLLESLLKIIIYYTNLNIPPINNLLIKSFDPAKQAPTGAPIPFSEQ